MLLNSSQNATLERDVEHVIDILDDELGNNLDQTAGGDSAENRGNFNKFACDFGVT